MSNQHEAEKATDELGVYYQRVTPHFRVAILAEVVGRASLSKREVMGPNPTGGAAGHEPTLRFRDLLGRRIG